MKLFATISIFVALYFMYRIAFPKQAKVKKGNEDSPKDQIFTDDVVGKSRPVSDYQRQVQPTPATPAKSENREENTDTFAAKNKKSEAEVPLEDLDKMFSVPMDIDYPLERETEQEPDIDAEEEAEELRQQLGSNNGVADGYTFEEMEQAVDAVNQPSKEKEAKAGRVLSDMEKTDMFEQLVLGDAGKVIMIKSIIDKYVQSMLPEQEIEATDNNNDYGNFEIADFLE